MLIRRYFGLLVLASVVCFAFLAFFDSTAWRKVSFTQSSETLERYRKQLGDLLSSDANSGNIDDGLLQESQNQIYILQKLVQKLVPNETDSYSETKTEALNVKEEDLPDICSPKENIVFLKTHKTGSSTLTNILNRYADLRGLKVAIPTTGLNRFRWPLQFHWSYVDMFLLANEYANVLCNHARYSRPSMDAIMELDSKYITILRNPIGQFESMFDYMEFSKDFGLHSYPDPMRRFLRRPFHYIRNMTLSGRPFPESMHLIRNGQFFDLGMSPTYYDNRTLILQEIAKLDRDFFLVLIMEYFDESLVLLKREMCWDFEDIVYAKMNQRLREKKEPLDYSLKKMIQRWNGADVLLYRHFNETFWKKIKKHGKAFYKDLEIFRRKNREVQKACISPVKAKEKAYRLTKEVTKLQINPDVPNFDRYFCQKILTDEIAYLKYFRIKYNPYFGYQRTINMRKGAQFTTPRSTSSLPTAHPNTRDNTQDIARQTLQGHFQSSEASFESTKDPYWHTRGNTRGDTRDNAQQTLQGHFQSSEPRREDPSRYAPQFVDIQPRTRLRN